MRRTLTPEQLDTLAPDDPEALRSRRDIRLFNEMMRSGQWFAAQLPKWLRAGERVLEIGAGCGELGASLRACIVPAPAGLDRWPRPPDWPADIPWHQSDVFDFAGWDQYDAVIGNLIFHHFNSEQLAVLGAAISQRARVILAFEPARRRRFIWVFALACRIVRANPVSRFDGRVSIHAGFLGDELPQLLRLDPAQWSWETSMTGRGAYRLVAVRRA